MCGRYSLSTPGDELAEVFDLTESLEVEPRFNIAPTQEAPIVRQEGSGRRISICRWGLIPCWADDVSIGARMINARSESAHQRPAFRDSFRRRRCLVPADGFYEWKTVGNDRQPYFFSRPDGEPFAFAGLWDRWLGGDEPLESYSVLTAPANGVVGEVHDRMPVILPADVWGPWLAAGDEELDRIRQLLQPLPDDAVVSRPVSTFVNSPFNDSPRCIQAVELGGEAEDDPQPSLF